MEAWPGGHAATGLLADQRRDAPLRDEGSCALGASMGSARQRRVTPTRPGWLACVCSLAAAWRVDASVARRAVTLVVPILALIVAAFLAPAASHGVRPLPRPHHSSAALPPEAAGVVARTLARDDPRFLVRQLAGGFASAGGGVSARFTRRGVVVDGDGLSWSPGLRAFGRGEHVSAVAPPPPEGTPTRSVMTAAGSRSGTRTRGSGWSRASRCPRDRQARRP